MVERLDRLPSLPLGWLAGRSPPARRTRVVGRARRIVFFGFGGTAQGDLLARAGRFLCYLNALSFRIRYDMPLCVVLDKCLASRAWTIPVCGAKSVST